MRRICSLLGVACFSLLLGCGGGGSDESTAAIPARAGSADIDAAGGSVDAVLEGGTQVTLIVPPGALTTKTSFRLDPQSASGGDLSAVQLTPAGLQFRTPARLVVTLPARSDPSNKLVSFGIGGVRVPIGAVDAATRTMTVDLPYLGVGGAAPASLAASGRHATIASTPPRPATATETTLDLFVQNGDLTSAVTLWHQLVATLASDGSRDNAIEVQEGFTALLKLSLDQTGQAIKDQLAVDITTWRNVDCGQLTSTINALNAFDFSSDFAGYAQRALDAIAFGRLTQDLFSLTGQVRLIAPLACPALQGDTSAPIRPSFPNYIAAATAALQALSPVDDFAVLLNTRLGQLLSFTAALETFGGIDDLAARVQSLATDQTMRLRAGAYSTCRSFLVVQAFQQDLLARELSDPGFVAAAPYNSNSMIEDIENCGMPIHWAVLDANDAVLQKGDAGGIGPGNAANAVTLTLTGASKLVLSGPLQALRCPSGANSNNEQLSFSAGPANTATSSVGLLTPSSDHSAYLAASDLTLSVAQLQALSQPNGGSGNGQLVVTRTGATCNGDFPSFTQHSVLVNFTLNFGGAQITSATLPDATVGSGYGFILASAGGGAPSTWSASGLPGGLSLSAHSGLISGVPTSAGTSTVEVTLRAADGSVSGHSFSLLVKPPTVRVGRFFLNVFGFCPQETINLNLSDIFTEVLQTGDQWSATVAFGAFTCNGAHPINTRASFTATASTRADGVRVLSNIVFAITYDNSASGTPNCIDQFPMPSSLAEQPVGASTQLAFGFFDATLPLSACGVGYQGFTLEQLGP